MTQGCTGGESERATDFPPQPLRHYAALADGERAALIGPHGNIAWLCAPRWHDDAVFSSLLGGRGHYAVSPADPRYVWGGHYEPGTLIWRNHWVIGGRILDCREALAYPGEQDKAVLLRRIEGVRGDTRVNVLLDCRAVFGREPMELARDGSSVSGDCWSGRTGPLHLRWTGVPPDGVRDMGDGCLAFDMTVPEGSHHDLVLEISARPLRATAPHPDRAWAATERAWHEAVPSQMDSVAPRDSQHAVAVLRGLTSSTGAMVAAATTSLPEHAEHGRDYDYRYAWIRDQCFAGQAAAAAGDLNLVRSLTSFVAERLLADGPRMRPAYTVEGGALPEWTSLGLPGYPGAPSVGTGNKAGEQFQLDAFGEALLLFSAADRCDALDGDGYKAAEIAARAIGQRYDQPDNGIWELSSKRWAHSRLKCAAGLRSYAQTLSPGGEEWLDLAGHLIAETDRECRHHTGRWQRAPDDTRVDAALLLPALRGALPASDPRSIATWRAVIDDLDEEGYVYRYRHDPGLLGGAEGAFLVCGFHLALSSHQQGDHIGATAWFERTRSAVGPPGLFTEEFDVRQRQLRGNLPQAFVHALLLETAHALTVRPVEGDTA